MSGEGCTQISSFTRNKLSKILFGQLFTSTGCESLNKRDGVSVVTASFGGDPEKVPQCPETKTPRPSDFLFATVDGGNPAPPLMYKTL